MKKTWKLFRAVMMVFVLICLCSLEVSAEEPITVGVNLKYGQSEARSMLEMINQFRTGSEAWYWNADDTTKTVYSEANGNALSPLVYDYELEKVAMLRAAEIAVSYSHERPSGGDVFSMFQWYAAGENIAAGYRSAEAVFAGWQETDDPYSGQGHRRNMLSPNVTAVGIGHVYYNGYHYWVQVFRAPTGTTSETVANDSETLVEVSILPSAITDVSLTSNVSSLTITYGDSTELPDLTTEISTDSTWPYTAPVELSYQWSVSDSGIASVSGTSIYGTKIGSTAITATVLGRTITIPVTVKPISIDTASVSLAQSSYTYDGTEKKPAVSSVSVGGKVLTAGTDYTVSWSNHVNAGTATVTVTGTGNYGGTATKTFEIQKADLSSGTMSTIAAQTYTSKELTPAVTVKYGTLTLSSGTDYTLMYSNNKNAGTATVTVTGKGNYTGSIRQTFEIQKADLSKGKISAIAAQAYTGKAITPTVTVTYGSASLKEGSDYTVSFSNNIKSGTASVNVKGIGNYQNSLTKSFTIKEPVTPKKGTKITDKTTGAIYKITKAGNSKTATVEYVKPTASKSTLVIPDTVVLNGVTCKVTSIAASACKGNKKLQTLTIGKNVTSIGKNAFYGCVKLTKVTIGKAVTSIGASAFYGCKKLSRIIIKTEKLTTKKTGSRAFGGIYSKAVFKVPAKKVSVYKKLLKARGISAKATVSK